MPHKEFGLWVEDDDIPELASYADLGMIIDRGDGSSAIVDNIRFGLLMAGIWVEMTDADESSWQTLRLNWISPVNGRHFFMDQRGITVAAYSPAEVAGLIDNGKLRIIDTLRPCASA